MPLHVRAALAAALRLEGELTSYELDAADAWSRQQQQQRRENAQREAEERVRQLELAIHAEVEAPEPTLQVSSEAPAAEQSRELPTQPLDVDPRLLVQALALSQAECARLRAECERLRQAADQAAVDAMARVRTAEQAAASRSAAVEAEMERLRRAAAEALASLAAARADAASARADAASARAEARAKTSQVAELKESVTKHMQTALSAAGASAQLVETTSKVRALEALARRGAVDAVALIDAQKRVVVLEKLAADQQAALGGAEAELVRLRDQALSAASLRIDLNLANQRAAALEERLEASAVEGADLVVANARVAILEARLAELSAQGSGANAVALDARTDPVSAVLSAVDGVVKLSLNVRASLP